jgi:N-methylhydantoinase B
MSNTRNTPVEALETSFPLRVTEYSLRRDSGGQGQHHGGEGLVRSIQFLSPVTVTITSERRERPPYGLQGGEPGKVGDNTLIRNGGHGKHGEEIPLPGKVTADLRPGDTLRIETPGGGGWGVSDEGRVVSGE